MQNMTMLGCMFAVDQRWKECRSLFPTLFVITVFHCAGDVESVSLQSFDLSVIANMVKKYLRELPDPVIPEDSYSSYIEAASM